MNTLACRVAAHKARRVLIAIAGLQLLVCAHTAQAQTPALTAVDQAPSEAARRAALSPYRFILQNANAPARKPAATSAPAPSPAAEAKRTAAPATLEQAAALPRSAPAPTPPPASAPASRASPTPSTPSTPSTPIIDSPVAALAPKPPEPAPRREIIPVKTDEPRLPASLMRERPSGLVRVQFEIQPDGSTGGVKVVSSTNRALNRPTVDAVSGWKFEAVDEVLSVETELLYKYE